jgi:hypothetical protein
VSIQKVTNVSEELVAFIHRVYAVQEEWVSETLKLDNNFLLNVGKYSPIYTASYSRKLELTNLLYYVCIYTKPIPVAARSKAWVSGRSLTGIVGSNPAYGMDVCLL